MNFQSNQEKNRSDNGQYNAKPPLSSGRNFPQGPEFSRSAYRSMPLNAGIPAANMLRGEQLDSSEGQGITAKEQPNANIRFSGSINITATWKNPKFRQIPNYYPLESTTKEFPMNQIHIVMANLSKSFRLMGIHAKYFENPAGAALLTPEHVEICLYLWKTSNRNTDRIYVELQRRRGDALIFHRYGSTILNAADSGDFSEMIYHTTNDESRYLQAAKDLFMSEMLPCDEDSDSLKCIEHTADLLQKDRLDARILGMESLSILTDPRKTCWNTALMASRAVLLGSDEHCTFGVIQDFILCAIQKRRMSDEDSLMEDMIDYDSDDDKNAENYFINREDKDGKMSSEYHNAMRAIVNYSLKIISNALQVLTTSLSDNNTKKKELNGHAIIEKFYQKSLTLSHETDILTTLLKEIASADSKPHDACLAAKCLTLMCQSSKAARRRITSLCGMETVAHAEEIGNITNARLQTACGELQQVLVSM